MQINEGYVASEEHAIRSKTMWRSRVSQETKLSQFLYHYKSTRYATCVECLGWEGIHTHPNLNIRSFGNTVSCHKFNTSFPVVLNIELLTICLTSYYQVMLY